MDIDVYALAHEVKNPLTVVKGYLEMDKSSNFSKYKTRIMANIEEALEVLDDCLEYNKIIINKEVMDTIFLLEEVLDNYKNLYDINLELISVYDELFIKADYNRLKQVFNNIIKNSIEAKSKNIKIYVKVIEHNIVINIWDDGNGINSFSDLENNISSKVYGHGIGTMIIKKIIKYHKGRIIYNNNDDKGCNVTINLPINM